jgi:predicted regulator of Ras-like GTPase activity (Roadblock/LC7/MglB family)
MERFIISDLLRIKGITNVALLDKDGLVVSTGIEHHQQTKDISKIADMIRTKDNFSRITITSEKAILIVDSLETGFRLVSWCEQSCNLGLIRNGLDNSINKLNAYLSSRVS